MSREPYSAESYPRLVKVAAYVKNGLETDAVQFEIEKPWLEYRWLHTLRVANIGNKLAKAEGANVELAVAGCLLHDIASLRPDDPEDIYGHGRVGAQLIRPRLPELGYSIDETDNICYSVAAHADGKAGYDYPHTLEAKIVSDADNIDRFDAYRLLEFCQPHMGDFEKLVLAVEERLTRLEAYRGRRVMETETGHDLFNQKLDMQILVYKALVEQHRLSSLANLPGLPGELE
jgi:putative nucleotidyltransferase with HDIG domain